MQVLYKDGTPSRSAGVHPQHLHIKIINFLSESQYKAEEVNRRIKMKVAEYHKKGLKNFVEEKPEGYKTLGSAKEGVHRVEIYILEEDGKIKDAKFSSSKRCKKLMAIADLVTEKIKGLDTSSIGINDEEILQFFQEEREKDKMKNRLEIVKKAV